MNYITVIDIHSHTAVMTAIITSTNPFVHAGTNGPQQATIDVSQHQTTVQPVPQITVSGASVRVAGSK